MNLAERQATHPRVAESVGELRAMLDGFRPGRGIGRTGSVALVPTMGCLHAGHARLIREARGLADTVVVSIYVNPLQFGPNEDFTRYPRSFEADLAVCAEQGADIVFHPADLYPEGGPKVSLSVRDLNDVLCGAARPGHFDGVVTVVSILFNAVQPDLAVFGEKDWQQLSIIRRMVQDLVMPVDIVGVPTVREADGLAMSSRNRYLDKHEREQALVLSRTLEAMRELAGKGERNASLLIAHGHKVLDDAGLAPEYLEIRDAEDLTPVGTLGGRGARAFVAARVGAARLIDNMSLKITRLEKS